MTHNRRRTVQSNEPDANRRSAVQPTGTETMRFDNAPLANLLADLEAERYEGYGRILDEEKADSDPNDPDRRYAEGVEAGVQACEAIVRKRLTELMPTIEVRVIGDTMARLFVNGFGVATWDADVEVRGTGVKGLEYAQECARVLRKALGDKETDKR